MFWKLKSRTFSLVRSSCLFIDDWYWTDYWCLFLSSSAASLSCSTVNTSWRETPPCPRRPPGSSSTAKSVTAARLQTPDQTPHPWQGGNQCCHVQQNWCCPAARVLLQNPPPESSSWTLLQSPWPPPEPLISWDSSPQTFSSVPGKCSNLLVFLCSPAEEFWVGEHLGEASPGSKMAECLRRKTAHEEVKDVRRLCDKEDKHKWMMGAREAKLWRSSGQVERISTITTLQLATFSESERRILIFS